MNDSGGPYFEIDKREASKEFQPQKQKEGADKWQRVNMEQQSGSTFTPFGTATMSRTTTPQPAKDGRSGTLRPPTKSNPFVFEAPQNQSTPKMPHSSTLNRPGSAMQMDRQHKLTWGRLPPSSGRSCSAMGQSNTLRPASRVSEAGMGNGIGSRYQSYCTLPRPEQLDVHSLAGVPQCPPYHIPKVLSRPPSIAPPTMAFGPRPHSAMSNSMHYPVPPPSLHPHPSQQLSQPSQPSRPIVNWNTLSLYGSLLVICSLVIFGIGVARVFYGAKWAIGVELAYSLSTIGAGLIAIYAVKGRRYSAAAFTFVLSAFNLPFALLPFIIGLFPTIPWAFPELSPSYFLSVSEPVELDLALSIAVFFQVVFCLIMCFSACNSIGVVCSQVEEIKL